MAVFKITDREGKTRLVDAKSAIKAIQHVFLPDVQNLSASEVAKLARDHEVEDAEESVGVVTTTKSYGDGGAA